MFVQPFGLESAGGGARILRSLVAGHEREFVSVSTGAKQPPPTDLGIELHLPARRPLGRVDSTRLGPWADWAGNLVERRRFRRRLTSLIARYRPCGIHSIAHDTSFPFVFAAAAAHAIPFTLTIHDELGYNLYRHPRLPAMERALERIWLKADRRIVICESMGERYKCRFGDRPYDVVTDGLTLTDPMPRVMVPRGRRIYFMGSIHRSYDSNFRALSEGANRLVHRRPELNVTLVTRGGSPRSDPGGLAFQTLPWATEEEVTSDLDSADLLYLPIPFAKQHESFARFSLPTKLVTYLGSGLPILYHGPPYSSSAALLNNYSAAIQIHTNRPEDVADALEHATAERRAVAVEGAIRLTQDHFDGEALRRKFWSWYELGPPPAVEQCITR